MKKIWVQVFEILDRLTRNSVGLTLGSIERPEVLRKVTQNIVNIMYSGVVSDYHRWVLINLLGDIQCGIMASTRTEVRKASEKIFGESWQSLYRQGFRIRKVVTHVTLIK